MRNDWLYPMDSDSLYPDLLFSLEPFVVNNFAGLGSSNLLQSLLENSRTFGSVTIHRVSRIAGALLLWFTSASGSNLAQGIAGSINNGGNGIRINTSTTTTTSRASVLKAVPFVGNERRKKGFSSRVNLGKVTKLMMRLIWKEAKKFQSSYPVLSLAAALVPPIQNLSSNVLAGPFQDPDVQMHTGMNQMHKEAECQGCPRLSLYELNLTKAAVEPKTGIEFPMVLVNALAGEQNSSLNSEVLVGTGSRTMTIVKIKSLKIYAFGFYVHPYSLCEKLGPKYASISADELNKRHDFYQDLLREDINMTVRLVVNCKGMRVNSVKDAFEKSLRARLVKTNPSTDFHCLSIFGSCFQDDIPLPLGTVIEFRRTVDGRLITDIGGNQIGSVQNKDLCRAFFDMYIGDVPVSEQAKEEIGRNVANMIRRC